MKRLLLVCIIILGAAFAVCAQQSGKYVVWFRNGSSIECMSFEQTEEGNLRIVRLDGKEVAYSMSVVDRITPFNAGAELPEAIPEVVPEAEAAGGEDPGTVTTAQDYRGRPDTILKTGVSPSGQPYGGQYEWVRVVPRKEPFLAGLCSAVIPGLGQFYNGQVGYGFAFMGSWLAMGAGAYFFGVDDDLWPVGIVFGAAAAGTWVWSILHASNTSKKINLQRGYALGGGKYLNVNPAVLGSRTFSGNSYHYGMSLSLAF